MRLSWYELEDIKKKIKKDLYGHKYDELAAQKKSIAEKNRKYFLNHYQHLLDELPEDMVTRHKEYAVRITYPWGTKPNLDNDHKVINEIWKYESNTELINPVKNNGYYPAEQSLHPDLKDETEKLCQALLVLNGESAEMHQYLRETTTKFSGSQQLRKVWPKPFHKYLPAEPKRAKRKAPETDPDLPKVPTGLSDRLTTNLLEDN